LIQVGGERILKFSEHLGEPRNPWALALIVTKSIGLGHMLFDLRNDRNQPADLDRYFNCFHESSFLSANEAVPTEI
jgi:hypothetical protein